MEHSRHKLVISDVAGCDYPSQVRLPLSTSLTLIAARGFQCSTAGSLSAAARRLNTPVATVSRKVTDLEAHLRTKLFNRSTTGKSTSMRSDRSPSQKLWLASIN